MSAPKKPPLSFDLDAGPVSREPAPSKAKTPKPAKPAATKEKRTLVGFRLKDQNYRRLKASAAMQGRPVQDLCDQAISEFLERNPI